MKAYYIESCRDAIEFPSVKEARAHMQDRINEELPRARRHFGMAVVTRYGDSAQIKATRDMHSALWLAMAIHQ